MAIPEDVQKKLDSDPSWKVQHEDIVRVMEDNSKSKPWSRYMIQQHLDGPPTKGPLNDRLNELVELGVVKSYEYNNHTLYDLAYDPIVTDGGNLRDASPVDVVTLQDLDSVRDLSTGALFTSFLFLIIGVLASNSGLETDVAISGNFYVDAAIVLYAFGILLVISVSIMQRIQPHLAKFGSE